jgi:cobalt-zinc-cadmium efflux system outer membrane protein
VPDIEVGVSVGRNHGDDENLVELGVSIPLSVFDKRQGAIQAAEAELAAATAMVDAIEAELDVALAAVQAEIAGHRAALAAHDERVTPLADADYEQTVERFRAGKASLLDLLDAVRSRAEARLHRLDLLNALNRSTVELRNLTTYPTPPTP